MNPSPESSIETSASLLREPSPHGSTRWTIYFLSTYLFGVIPGCTRWSIDSLQHAKYVDVWSLPEGYIFAFLLATITFTESFNCRNQHEPIFDNVRVAAVFLSAVIAVLCALCYAAMQTLPDKAAPIAFLQPRALFAMVALNVAFMSYKLITIKAPVH